ncbi:GNAT family N-acetyltransferase [Streptomyces sp. NPDC097107]|uniref:GNAT family N-acetyltransferase n=1 Tax=Streptomyces sp. NPDC097107 TaxID=3366089 RepID=UPI0037F523BF
MTSEQHSVAAATPRAGGADDDLEQRPDDELTAFNTAAAGGARTQPLTVRVTDAPGALAGGLTAWTWSTLASVDVLWVCEEQRQADWGSRLMRAGEEAVRRGCSDMIVSTHTFQAPGFYPRLGFRERGRVEGVPGGHEGVPGGHEDVYFHKRIGVGGTGGVLGA